MNADPRSALEIQFPRILEKIIVLWGNRELDPFLTKLMVDERGDREGFPSDVMSELMFLSTLHNVAYPFQLAKSQYANRRNYDNSWS